jgi:hypothetical protein
MELKEVFIESNSITLIKLNVINVIELNKCKIIYIYLLKMTIRCQQES